MPPPDIYSGSGVSGQIMCVCVCVCVCLHYVGPVSQRLTSRFEYILVVSLCTAADLVQCQMDPKKEEKRKEKNIQTKYIYIKVPADHYQVPLGQVLSSPLKTCNIPFGICTFVFVFVTNIVYGNFGKCLPDLSYYWLTILS